MLQPFPSNILIGSPTIHRVCRAWEILSGLFPTATTPSIAWTASFRTVGLVKDGAKRRRTRPAEPVLDKTGRPKNHSIMRSKGKSDRVQL